MYEHVVVEHQILLYCSTASTAPYIAISSHNATKQVRIDQSATTQASNLRKESHKQRGDEHYFGSAIIRRHIDRRTRMNR